MKALIQRTFNHSVAAAAMLVLATTSANLAFADGHGKGERGDKGGRMGHHGMMHNMTPEMAEKFAQRRVERLAKQVGASEEQKAKMLSIAKESAKQAQAQHSKMEDVHNREKALMAAPTLDRAAIEKLNTEKAAQHDAMRKIREKAQLDTLEVLTPEQRAKMGEKMHMGKKQGEKKGKKQDKM